MTTEGTQVGGRYRLDQPIGRGRAGIVWLAYDTRLHRTVATKRMFIPSGLDPAAAEHARVIAMREARDAARVSHTCAITVHDVLREGGDVWLVMEYVPSRNMADFLEEHGTLTAEQAASLGVQLGAALTAAHSAGVTHRSLEPGNVLLADDGGVKITDIGITGGGPTPAYLAPELARGEPAAPPADAFALGATLYAAVEGTPPYGENGQGGPPAPQLSGPLTGALLKLLRPEPATRPTVPDTVTALAAITHGQHTAIVPPTAPAMRPPPQLPQQAPVQQVPTPQTPVPQAAIPQTALPQTPVPPTSLPQAPAPQTPAPQTLATQAPAPPPSAHQPTVVHAPVQRPLAQAAPANPDDEPTVVGLQPVRPPQRPRQQSGQGQTGSRTILLTVLAVLIAAAVGILVTELLFV